MYRNSLNFEGATDYVYLSLFIVFILHRIHIPSPSANRLL